MHASARTTFDPRRHGFAFGNTFSTTLWDAVSVGPVHIPSLRLGGLCGGMTFAALDNFYADRPAATTDDGDLPGADTPLYAEIYRRHLASVGLRPAGIGVPVPHSEVRVVPTHLQNALRYPLLRGAPAPLRRRENRNALIALRRWLTEGYPVPLGLISPHALTDSHQVVAYGFDDGVHATVVQLYDCRYPAKTTYLTIAEDGSSCVLRSEENEPEPWQAFFVAHYDRATITADQRALGLRVAQSRATEDVS